LVEYIGPADLSVKNDLLGNSMAMLFPVQWTEPFGLVMVEAMACGTSVGYARRVRTGSRTRRDLRLRLQIGPPNGK